MKNAIVVKNLTVSFHGQKVLDDVSFMVPEGQIAAIIGPNGSGKSTLLKAILGLISYKEGRILLMGERLRKVRPLIGYVPQRFTIDRTLPMTVDEFLRLALVERKDAIMIYQVLEEVGMENKRHYLLGILSGGELQRILIARALLRKPQLLFLDEPSSGVDIEGEETFYQLIHSITDKYKTTTLLVSHEIDIVPRHAEMVVCLNKKVVCQGTPQDVLNSEVLQALYSKHAGWYEHH